jgi:PKD repeat protein
MKKRLQLITLLLASGPNILHAQTLFKAPDTVCIRQEVHLVNHVKDASSYYWGFCSGYLKSDPTGIKQTGNFGLNDPGAMDVVKIGDNYHAFVVNRGSANLLRYDFGTSLSNTPAVTDLGTLNNSVPVAATGLAITQDSIGNWFVFITGGTGQSDASFARFEFGRDIKRVPNSINFGNMNKKLSIPRGVMVEHDSLNWYAWVVDEAQDELIRIDFGNDLMSVPMVTSFGNIGGLSGPTDIAVVRENRNWYFLITNGLNSTISVVTTGTHLGNAPVGINIGNLGDKLFNPSHIILGKDCGATVAFVLNQLNNNLTRIDIPAMTGLYTGTLLGVVADISGPGAMTRVIRERDTLFSFVPNGDNSLSVVLFPQCTDASITSSTDSLPPVYSYANPGTYNVYLVINEGLPDMQVECQQIVVLPPPAVTISPDTVLCQRDMIPLFIQSHRVVSYTWSPYYNISDTLGMHVNVWPDYSLSYNIRIRYEHGCIWDTSIRIDVSKVTADAGPDRTIGEGGRTVLGGAFTSVDGGRDGERFAYRWTPSTFLSDPNVPNPVTTTSQTITYYLEVTELNDTLLCKDRDTVVVYVECEDLILPNAFVPEGTFGGPNTFGLMNRQLIKLNYFRVYDRWGHVVFSTTDPSKQWDGRVNGEYLPPGVYVWEADGFCTTGQRFQRQGNVTLLR